MKRVSVLPSTQRLAAACGSDAPTARPRLSRGARAGSRRGGARAARSESGASRGMTHAGPCGAAIACLLLSCCGGVDRNHVAAQAERNREESAEVLDILCDIGLPRVGEWWRMDELSWLRAGLDEIQAGSPTVRRLTDGAGLQECLAADVLLVADDHTISVIRTGLVRLLTSLRRVHAGPLALALEALPADRQEAIAALPGEDDAALLAELQDHWAWPVEAYVPLLGCARRLGITLLAVGDPSLPTQGRPAGPSRRVGDEVRRPPPTPIRSARDALDPAAVSAAASRIVDHWLREERRAGATAPKVIALLGGAHLAGPDHNLKPSLTRRGHRSVLLVLGNIAWEYAVRRRWPALGAGEWIRVADDVYRPGGLQVEDWHELARAREQQFSVLVRGLPSGPESGQTSVVMNTLARLADCSPRRAAPWLRAFAARPAFTAFAGYLTELAAPDPAFGPPGCARPR